MAWPLMILMGMGRVLFCSRTLKLCVDRVAKPLETMVSFLATLALVHRILIIGVSSR